MVNYQLARNLISAGAIRQNTEVTTYFEGTGMDGRDNARRVGSFHIRSARMTKEKVIFEAYGHGRTITLTNEDIIDLDGMSPKRFAQVNGYHVKGDPLPKQKRRGRKTNAERAQIAAAKAAAEAAGEEWNGEYETAEQDEFSDEIEEDFDEEDEEDFEDGV